MASVEQLAPANELGLRPELTSAASCRCARRYARMLPGNLWL